MNPRFSVVSYEGGIRTDDGPPKRAWKSKNRAQLSSLGQAQLMDIVI